jgi:hypothetical protein
MAIVQMTLDLEFLTTLNGKLREHHPGRPGDFRNPAYDVSTSESMTLDEYTKILAMVTVSRDLILYPENMNFGLSVGFGIDYCETVGQIAERKRVLSFTERQLPKNITFDDVAKVFNNHKNLQIMEFYGLEKPRERTHYDY